MIAQRSNRNHSTEYAQNACLVNQNPDILRRTFDTDTHTCATHDSRTKHLLLILLSPGIERLLLLFKLLQVLSHFLVLLLQLTDLRFKPTSLVSLALHAHLLPLYSVYLSGPVGDLIPACSVAMLLLNQ